LDILQVPIIYLNLKVNKINDLNSIRLNIMSKFLNQTDVIDILSRKIEVKTMLRDAKKTKDVCKITSLTTELHDIELKLKSTPLSKT
jgi:hypothetical protein